LLLVSESVDYTSEGRNLMAAPSAGTDVKFRAWNMRRKALWTLREFMQTRPEFVASIDDVVDRTGTIRRLLQQLQYIGDKQFSFFQHGFDTGSNLLLQPDKNISYAYALGRTLDQVANDLIVIQRAQEQRMVSLGGNQKPTIAKALTVADKLAYIVLAMMRSYLSEEQTTVLTYLHKSPNVRVLPYAAVVIIGIPITVVGVQQQPGDPASSEDEPSNENEEAVGVASDLLAIPHEFAHHLYWNGQLVVDGQPKSLRALLQAAVDGQPLWLQRWVEEIFADVVTALIGGPLAALSFQDLLLKTRNHEMLLDNNQHPMPILRPYIYTETLRHVPGMTHAPDQLEARWRQKLQEHNLLEAGPITPKQMVLFPQTSWAERHEDTARYLLASPFALLQAVIQQVLTLVPPQAIQSRGLPLWSTDVSVDLDLTDEEQVATLYAAFEETGIQHLLTIFADLCGDRSHEEVLNPQWAQQKWDELLDRHQLFAELDESVSLPAQWRERLRSWEATGALNEPLELPPTIWQRILEFAGWTTEGPENQPAAK